MARRETRSRLVAIMAADAVGFSRLMAQDDRRTVGQLDAARVVFRAQVALHGGRLVDTAGDSVLATFETAGGAVSAAVAIQKLLEETAAQLQEHEPLRFRIGLHLGDVMQKPDGSVYGDGVNVAARLQAIAAAGEIVASETIRVAAKARAPATFEYMGEQALKNLPEAVHAHRVVPAQMPSAAASAIAYRSPSSMGRWLRAGAPGTPISHARAAYRVRTVAFAAVIALALGGFIAYEAMKGTGWPFIDRAAPVPAPLSVLVLPFANQTGDPAKAYLADGLTTSISADLARIRDLFVVPVATSFAYRDKALSVQQIGKEAAVNFVLQGGVLTSGSKVRIVAQLAETTRGAQLWNETFEGTLEDLFALQDQVTARIGNSVGPQMVVAAAHETELHRNSGEVVDLLMRARALEVTTRQSIANFRQLEAAYREVLRRAPENLDGMAGLAVVLAVHAGWLDESDPLKRRLYAEAKSLAVKVVAADPTRSRAYNALAMCAMAENDIEAARRAHDMRLQYEPKNQSAYNNFALFFREIGEPEKAIPLLQRALQLHPKADDVIFDNLGSAYLETGDNDSAIRWLLKSVDMHTELPDAYANLAMAYANKGDSRNAAFYAAEFRKRAATIGFKGLEANAPSASAPPAVQRYYRERQLPEWKRAGLP